ncbi:AAA family ATPase [Anaerotruncus rubiinfantis]|uniref:AAA family ATPase n=1 Tax=Anaerotruncus rubiinfantis TaxID=1720200 RepID=UPI0018974787|nr:AAA family ATPase [Anaerotruncus rubiinfantis]
MTKLPTKIGRTLWRSPFMENLLRDGITLVVGLVLASILIVATPFGATLAQLAAVTTLAVAVLYYIAKSYTDSETNRQRTILADFVYFAFTDTHYTLSKAVQGIINPETIFDSQKMTNNTLPVEVQSEIIKIAPSTLSAEQKTLWLQTLFAAAYQFGQKKGVIVSVLEIDETRTTLLLTLCCGPVPRELASPSRPVKKSNAPAPKAIIHTFPRADLLQYDLLEEVPANLNATPHICVVGETGSGKTTACKTLVNNVLNDIPESTIWVLDYKGEDFQFLQNCTHYFQSDLCVEGLETFYQKVFLSRKNRESSARDRVILLVEEYSSLLLSLDKAQAQRVRTIIGNLLRLSRAFAISVILTCQRADAQLFDAGARDNFGIVAGFSALSDESKRMLFSDYLDDMKPISGTGRGYIAITGVGLAEVEVLPPDDSSQMEQLMRSRCK